MYFLTRRHLYSLWDTLRRAQNVVVPENDLTREFLDARITDYCEGEERNWSWESYKARCRDRHQWGQYLRSNLDWNWDVAGSLRRLFRAKNAVVISPLPTSYESAIDPGRNPLSVTQGEAAVAIAGDAWKMIQIRYKIASGETKYKNIPVNISSEDVSSIAILLTDDAEEVSGEALWIQRERLRTRHQ